jgi:hypothetical protein
LAGRGGDAAIREATSLKSARQLRDEIPALGVGRAGEGVRKSSTLNASLGHDHPRVAA